jgi:hypothetical protein
MIGQLNAFDLKTRDKESALMAYVDDILIVKDANFVSAAKILSGVPRALSGRAMLPRW